MNLFSFVAIFALAATLLVGCEPQKEAVDPKPVKSSQNARIGYTADDWGYKSYGFGSTPAVATYRLSSGDDRRDINHPDVTEENRLSVYNMAVEVHRTADATIAYTVFSDLISPKNVSEDLKHSREEGDKIDDQSGSSLKGMDPTVALNKDGKFVIVCEDGQGRLTYVLGKVDNYGHAMSTVSSAKTVSFTGDVKGHRPAIAFVSATTLVLVYEALENNELRYTMGTLDTEGGIKWSVPRMYDHGQDPSIAVNERGQFIEVHKSQFDNSLWYRLGTVTGGQAIVFTAWGRPYAMGQHPCVGLDYYGNIIEMHTSDRWVDRTGYNMEVDRITGNIDLNNNSFYQGSKTELTGIYYPSFAIAPRDFVFGGIPSTFSVFNVYTKHGQLFHSYSLYKQL